jgi:hypothetical protein
MYLAYPVPLQYSFSHPALYIKRTQPSYGTELSVQFMLTQSSSPFTKDVSHVTEKLPAFMQFIVIYRLHKTQTLDPISQLNPVHTLKSNFLKIQ